VLYFMEAFSFSFRNRPSNGGAAAASHGLEEVVLLLSFPQNLKYSNYTMHTVQPHYL
jgi:hypothetical protein